MKKILVSILAALVFCSFTTFAHAELSVDEASDMLTANEPQTGGGLSGEVATVNDALTVAPESAQQTVEKKVEKKEKKQKKEKKNKKDKKEKKQKKQKKEKSSSSSKTKKKKSI